MCIPDFIYLFNKIKYKITQKPSYQNWVRSTWINPKRRHKKNGPLHSHTQTTHKNTKMKAKQINAGDLVETPVCSVLPSSVSVSTYDIFFCSRGPCSPGVPCLIWFPHSFHLLFHWMTWALRGGVLQIPHI